MMRVIHLMRDVYDPFVHAYFALNWCLSFYLLWKGESFTFEELSEGAPILLVCTLVLFLVLFYLRLADEIKDYDYDVQFNPKRPLVTGKHTFRSFLIVSLVCLGLSLILAIPLGPYAVFFLILHFVYSFSLWPLESWFQPLKQSMMLNLLVTYPVNVSLSLFLLMVYSFEFNLSFSPSTRDVLAVLVFATSFLYYEFSRKIDFKKHQNQRLYSNELGLTSSLVLNVTWAGATVVLSFILLETWFSLILFLPVMWGSMRYVKMKPYPFKITGGVFLGLFYGLIIATQFIRAF